MYKVCFNEKNQIIGFNINNCISYINLFDIANVKKEITQNKLVEKLDSFGRKVFLKKHKETGESVYVSLMTNKDNFEDELFEYSKQYIEKQYKRTVSLIEEADKFTFDDIINIKKNQLIKKFECSDCILYETFDNVEGKNYIGGKNFIKINENSTVSFKELKCKRKSEVMVYYETDGLINTFINNKICSDDFVTTGTDNIKLALKGDNETNIYSIGILFK